MFQETFGASERFACKVFRPPRSTQRKPLKHQSPIDPDRWLRTHLRLWAGSARNARKGFRRAVLKQTDLRAEGHVVNRKCVQRIWREEVLRVARKPSRKRGETNTCAITGADAPNAVWAFDFQFDSLRCETPVKLASIVDEHTRESLLDITDTSITSEKVIQAMQKVITDRVSPLVIRCDYGPEFISQALNEFASQKSINYIPQVNHGEMVSSNCSTTGCGMNA